MERFRRIPEPARADFGICGMSIVYDNLIFLSGIAFRNYNRRSLFNRGCGKQVTVACGSVYADKRISGLDLARIAGHSGYFKLCQPLICAINNFL